MGGHEEVHRLFAKGSLVEVRIDQEGFDGAWYIATVVDTPFEMKKRRTSSSGKYLVKYQTLLADDNGFEPLLEHMDDVKFLRPLPPTETTDDQNHQHSFELNDIVDAFHRDGWWTGVIARVFDNSKFVVHFHNPPDEIEFTSSELRVHREWVDCKWVRTEKQGSEQQRVDGLDNQTMKQIRKKRRTKSQVKRSYTVAKGNKGNAGGYTAEEIFKTECKTEVDNSIIVGLERGSEAENPLQLPIELSLKGISEPKGGGSYQRKKRGRPLKYPVFMEDVSPVRAMNECNEAGNRQHEYVVQSTAIVARGDSVSDKNQSLPFEKRSLVCSLVWKTIESMEVFQVMPQKPHFRPLDNCKEYVREGSAIGLMVTFAGVVERTAKLKFGDSRSIIDRRLRTLLELEIHGFDVESVRGRLSELLSKKERQGELQEKSKEVEKEILKRMQEKTKIAEEIYEIGKKRRELEKKIVFATLKNEMKDKEIAVLQPKLDVIGEDLQSAQRDFGRLVASPW